MFICPLCTLQAPKRSDDVHILRVMKCKNLYLSLVPPNVGSSKGIESESDYHPERSAMVMEKTDILSLKEHGSPVILHLVLDGKFEHYMVCYGFKDGYFIIVEAAHAELDK